MGRLIVLLAAAACVAPAAGAGAQTGEPVPYRTIVRDAGASSGYDAQTTLVIRDKRRWRRVWQRLQRVSPLPARPRIDFRRSTLIAVMRGMGTGRGIEVESVTREPSGLRVRVIDSRSGAGCVVAQWVTNPYELIRVPRTAEPVITERVERVRDC